MILLCDENISPRVPESLASQGMDARSFKSLGWLGKDDLEWLPLAGVMEDALALTCDRMILENPVEYAAIIDNNLGIVFLTSGELPVDAIVRLLTSIWTKLEDLHNTASRPFIKFLTSGGLLLDEFNK